MANNFRRNPRTLILGTENPPAITTQVCNTVYSFGSTGAVIGWRFCAPSTTTLAACLAFITATTGAGNTVTFELRNDSAGSTVPGTLVTNGTATVASGTTANKWVKATFATPPSVTAGTWYWIVVGNAAADAASNNFTVVRTSGVTETEVTSAAQGWFVVGSSTNGFSTNVGTSSAAPVGVISFSDGSYIGNPYTQGNVGYASSTLERGLKISGLTGPLSISGLMWVVVSPNVSGVKIYSDAATAPGGTTVLNESFSTSDKNIGAHQFASPITLQASTVYRVVFTFSGNTTAPQYQNVQDSSTFLSDLVAVSYGGGGFCDTIDNGAGGWTDNTDRIPQMAIWINDLVAGGSAGTPLIGSPLIRSHTGVMA